MIRKRGADSIEKTHPLVTIPTVALPLSNKI